MPDAEDPGKMPPGKTAAKPAAKAEAKPGAKPGGENPDWAQGLKRLYESVVEEPLPDSFKDLLSRLDDDKT